MPQHYATAANIGLPLRLEYRLGLRHIPLCHFDRRAISCQVLRTRGTSASLFVIVSASRYSKRIRRDRHPCLNIVRRRLTTAYRFAWNTGLVFDTFRFVTSIAGQSRAKSFGHAERRQACSLVVIP
jgi:hypothetical protein